MRIFVALGMSGMGAVMDSHFAGREAGLVRRVNAMIFREIFGFIGGVVVAVVYNSVLEATDGVDFALIQGIRCSFSRIISEY